MTVLEYFLITTTRKSITLLFLPIIQGVISDPEVYNGPPPLQITLAGNLYTKNLPYIRVYLYNTVYTLESVSYLPVLRAIGETSFNSAV